MTDDWQKGDLALCVRGAAVSRPGCIYTVMAVEWLAQTVLWFEGCESDYADGLLPSSASRFRKLRPHEADAEDRETIRLLNDVPALEPVA